MRSQLNQVALELKLIYSETAAELTSDFSFTSSEEPLKFRFFIDRGGN